jgi:hypothetical protein
MDLRNRLVALSNGRASVRRRDENGVKAEGGEK